MIYHENLTDSDHKFFLFNYANNHCLYRLFSSNKNFLFLMTNGHENLHIRVELSEFYFNNDSPYLVFIIIPIKWCTNLQIVLCKNFQFFHVGNISMDE